MVSSRPKPLIREIEDDTASKEILALLKAVKKGGYMTDYADNWLPILLPDLPVIVFFSLFY